MQEKIKCNKKCNKLYYQLKKCKILWLIIQEAPHARAPLKLFPRRFSVYEVFQSIL